MLQELKGIEQWLCQDLNKRLSKWFASRPDALYVLRKNFNEQQFYPTHPLRDLREQQRSSHL